MTTPYSGGRRSIYECKCPYDTCTVRTHGGKPRVCINPDILGRADWYPKNEAAQKRIGAYL